MQALKPVQYAQCYRAKSYPCNRPWRLTNGGEVVNLTRRPHLYPQEDSWYSFLLEAESIQGHSAAGRIRSIEKSNDLIGNQTHDLPACSIVPQPTTLPRALNATNIKRNIQ
jgi:hypothetical protein